MSNRYDDEEEKKKRESQSQAGSRSSNGLYARLTGAMQHPQGDITTTPPANPSKKSNGLYSRLMNKTVGTQSEGNATGIELNRKHYDSLHKNDNQNTTDYSKIAELNRKHYEDRKNALGSKDEIDVDQVLADNNVKVSPKVQGIFDEAFTANDYRTDELKKAEENLNNVSPFDTDKAAYNKAMYDYERAKTNLDLSKNKEKYDAALESKAAELGLTEEEVEQLRNDTEQYNYGGEKLMHSLLGVGVNKLIPAPGVANSIARQANLNYDKQMLEDFDEDALKESIGNRGYQLLVERNRKNEDFAERNQIEKDKALDASANYLSINDNSSGITDALDDTFYASMEEQQNYNYLYNTTYDKAYEEAINSGVSEEEAKTIANSKANEEANKYLDTLGLDAKRTAMFAGFSKEYAEEHPILATASSIAFKPLEAIGQVDNALQYIGGNPNDENSLANLPAQMNTTMRGTVRNNIDNPLLKFGYDVGTSMGDMVLSNRLGFGNNNLSLILMGGEAANETYTQLLNEGYTKTDAMVMSTVAGGAEIITEKIPMEEIFSADKKGIRQILKSALFEGVEEVESDVINDIADILYSQISDRGQIKSEIEAYMAKGMSEEDAQYAVFNDHLKQAAYDFGAGAGSGGLANAYHGAVTTAVGMKNTNQLSDEAQKTIANIAVNSKDSKLAKLAEKVVNGTANAYEKYKTVRDTIDENNIGQQIEDKLIDEGVSKKEVEEAKAAIVKTIAQVDLTENEYDIAQSEPVRKVMSDISKGDLDASYERQLAINDALKMTKNNVNTTQTQNVTPNTETTENGAETNVESADESKKVVALSNYARNAQQRLGTMPIESLNDIQDVVNDEEGNIQIVTNDGNKVNNPYVKNRALGVVISNATTLFNDGASAKAYIQNFDPAMNLKAYNTITTEMIKAGKADAGTDKSTLLSTVKSLQNMGGDVGYYAKKLPASFFNDMYAYGVKEENQRSEVVAGDPQRNVVNAIANQFSKSGLNITIEDNNTDYNGKLVGTNNLVLSSHADKALMSVLSHELTHYFKKKTNLYNDYEKAVIDFLKESGQYEGLVEAKKKQGYADNEIDEEIVADAAENFLSDKKVIDRVCKNDKNLAKKIISWLNQTIKDLKKLFGSADPRTAEGRIMKNLEKQNLAKYEEIRDLWVNAYEAAAKSENIADTASEVKNSLKNMSDAELQTDYDKALKAGNEELAAQIVEQYANNKGFTERLYHGTKNFGFTKLDVANSDDNISFFATNKPMIASSYSGVYGKRGITEDTSVPEDKIAEELEKTGMFKEVIDFPKDDMKSRNKYLDEVMTSMHRFVHSHEKEMHNRKLYQNYLDFANTLFDMRVFSNMDYKKLTELLLPLTNAHYVISDYANKIHDALLLTRESNVKKHALLLDGVLRTAAQAREWFLPSETSGNYELFANTDNMLEIDGKGNNWSDIKVEKPVEKVEYTTDELIAALGDTILGKNKEITYIPQKNTFKVGKWEYTRDYVEKMIAPMPEIEHFNTRELAQKAKNEGYEGVIIRNITDDGGRNLRRDFINEHGDIYIFFNPQSQCKSADTVTYDDQGNVIPLSKRFKKENDDIRFSMKQPIEQNKDLIAAHNISEENLLKTLKLGGFPMPSIAVTKPEYNPGSFGTISVLFDKNTIDPKLNKANRGYFGDAWTSTAPNTVKKINQQKLNALHDKLGLSGDYSSTFQKDMKDIVRQFLDNDQVKEKFIKDKGVEIEKKPYTNWHHPRTAEILNILKDSNASSVYSVANNEELKKKLAEAAYPESKLSFVNKGRAKYVEMLEHIDDSAENLNKFLEDKDDAYVRTYMNLYQDIFDIVNDQVRTEWDKNAYREDINKYINENKEEFRKFIEDAINDADMYEGEYFRKPNVSEVTNNGRRSFEQLHIPYNAENMLKLMLKDKNAIKGWFGGASNLRGAITKEYKSIEDIKKNEGKLNKVQREEVDAKLSELNTIITDIDSAIKKANGWSGWTADQDINETLAKLLKKTVITDEVARSVFAKDETKFAPEILDKVIELKKGLLDLPIQYFESKPERIVNFDEIRAVLIPDNSSAELKEALDKAGIPYEEYKAGDEADRLAKLNSHDEIKFSKKNADTVQKRNVTKRDVNISIKEHLNELNKMQPVASININLPKLNNKNKILAYLYDKFDKIGHVFYKKGLGKYEIQNNDIKKAAGYGDFTDAEIAVMELIPQVVENGIRIRNYENYDNRNVKSATFAAPVSVNGKIGNMAVVIKETTRRYYKIHKILTPDGKEFIFENKKDAARTGVVKDNSPANAQSQSSFDNSISSSEQNVNNSDEKKSLKQDNQGRKLSENQQKFFAESKAVDKDGHLKELYHGTKNFGFNIFDPSKADDEISLFFTDDKKMANTYVDDMNKVYSVYLNLTNPLVIKGNGAKWNELILPKDVEARKLKLDDEKLTVINAIEEYMNYIKRYDAYADKSLLWDELGYLADGVDYLRSENEEMEIYSEDDLNRIEELATILDDAYNNWDDSEHLDDEGYEQTFREIFDTNQYDLPRYTTRQIAKMAKEQGHDGVIFENIRDNGKLSNYIGRGDVYIAFNSNQVKSVDNLNPTDDPDIRYSKKMLDDIGVKLSNKYTDADEMFFSEDTWENSEAQNSAKNTADILKEGFNDLQKLKEAGKAHFTHADALRLAEKYQREYGTSTGKEYIANNIESIFAYIENNRDNVRYDDMLRVMRDAAMPIVEKQSNELAEYDDFRKYVKDLNISLNDQQRAEVINTYGSMKTFRKAIGSRINVTDNGQNIDSLWQDICEASGYYLDPDENSNTQILALADALDSMRNVSDNSGMSTSDKAYDLALNIFTDYFKLNGVENVTKQMKKQIEDYKIASEKMYKQILDNQKKESKAELDRLRNELKLVEADRARLAAAKTLDTDELDHYDMLLKMERKQSANYEETLAQYDKYLDKQRKRILKLKADIEQGKIDRKSARLKAAESRQKTVLRNRIKSIVHNLSKMVTNPTEGSHVPVGLVNATIDVLQTIDLNTGKSVNMAEKLRKLSDKYQAIQKGYEDNVNPDYDATLEAMINQLRKTFEGRSIAKLTQSELEEVFKICAALQTQIRNTNKLINTQLKEDIYEAGQSIIDDVRAAKGVGTSGISNALNTFAIATSNAERFFDMLSGFEEDSALNKLYDDLNEGQHKMMQIEFDVSDIMKPVLEGKENQKLADKFKGDNLKDWVDTPFKDKNGNTIRVPQSFRASLALHMMNEQNLNHILYGGLTLPNEKLYHQGKIADAYARGNIIRPAETQQMRAIYKQIRNTETVDERIELWKKYNELQVEAEKVGLAKLQDMVDSMTPYEKAWVENAKKYFHEYSGKKINETSLKLNGYAKAVVDNYFPIKSDPSFTRSEMEGLKLDSTIEGWGNLKERTNGKNPIVLEGLDKVLNGHSKMLAKYAGMAIPIRNFNKVYNVTLAKNADSVKKAIKEKFGERSNKFISDLFTDLQTNRATNDNVISKLAAKLRSNQAAATLTANLPVTFSQAASLPTAAAELGWDAIGHTAFKTKDGAWFWAQFPTFWFLKPNTKNIMALAEKYTPLLKYRNLGNSTQELGDLKNKKTWFNSDKIRYLTNWIQNMDVTTVATLWKASEYRVAKDNPNLQEGTDEFYKEVAKVFNKAVERTQPNYTTLQRPDLLRNPSELVKFSMMYKTQPMQNLGIFMNAFGNLNAKTMAYKANPTAENLARKKAAVNKFARSTSALVVGTVTFVSFRLLALMLIYNLGKYRDDDKELTFESIYNEIIKEFGESLAGNIPFGTDVYNFVKSRVTGDKWYGVSLSAYETVNNICNDIGYLTDSLKNKNYSKVYSNTKGLIEDVSTAFGIPTKNIEKDLTGIKNHFSDIIHNEWGTFEAGVDRSKTQNNHILYKAMKEGNWDKFDKLYATLNPEKVTKDQGSVTYMIRDDYKAGDISDEKAEEYLQEIGFSKDDAHFKVQEWEHDGEDAGKSDYIEVFDAIDDFDGSDKSRKSIISAVDEMKDYGYSTDKFNGGKSITDHYRKQYIELYNTDKSAAINMKSALATAYTACGLSREKALKKIDDWVK